MYVGLYGSSLYLALSVVQDAGRRKNQSSYEKFVESSVESARKCTLRGQLDIVYLPEDEWLDINQIEPAKEIVKRFATGKIPVSRTCSRSARWR